MIFRKLRKFDDVLETLGVQLNFRQKLSLGRQLMAQTERLELLQNKEQMLTLAIDTLGLIAPLTPTTLDDGALLGLRALRKDAEFMSWLVGAAETAAVTEIPEGALANVQAPEFLQPKVEALNLGGLFDKIVTLLPMIIELVNLFGGLSSDDSE